MLRAFIAVDVLAKDPIARVQTELASAAGWSPREVKPVEPQNFHFTLIFLGEISDFDASEMQSKLAALRFDSFDITYAGIGGFPRHDAARVIWIGIDREGAKLLSEIAGKVVFAVSELGYKPDKPFSPHLTIFRVKTRQPTNIARLAEKYNDPLATDSIDRVHLKKSELTPSGPVYSNVYTVVAGK